MTQPRKTAARPPPVAQQPEQADRRAMTEGHGEEPGRSAAQAWGKRVQRAAQLTPGPSQVREVLGEPRSKFRP